MCHAAARSTEESLIHHQRLTPGRRVWLALGRVTLALAFLLIAGCDQPPAGGNVPQTSTPATICNASLFQQTRFSTSRQDGKMLYVAYDTDTSFTQTVVVALDASTHQQRWQRSFSVTATDGMRLTAADGIVYALFQRTNTDWTWLFALDAQTGQQLWAYQQSGAEDVAVCNGVVALLGTWSLDVFAAKTGKLLWKYGEPAEDERLGKMLALTDDTLYLITISLDGSEQATVRAFDLQHGKARWQKALPPYQQIGSAASLTLTEQALYVLQSSMLVPGHLIALRPQDGKQLWSASSPVYDQILTASDQTLYLGNIWQMDAYQTSNGKPLWSQRLSESTNNVLGFAQGSLLMSYGPYAFCLLNPGTGTVRWCVDISLLEWDGTPFFVDSATIYLFSDVNHGQPIDNHVLYVVDRQTGKVRTQFQIHALTGAITAL